MKYRVSFIDGVDLIVTAKNELDAIKVSKKLKDRLSKSLNDSKGYVVGSKDKTKFLKVVNGKYIESKSVDGAVLYPTREMANQALDLSRWDNNNFVVYELGNDYETLT